MIYDQRKSGLWAPRQGAPAVLPASRREAWAFRARQATAGASVNTGPIVTSGLEANWDAGNASSWTGSGLWQNLVASPASGAGKTVYDMGNPYAGTFPSLNGSVGSPSAYWAMTGSNAFTLASPSTNSTFLNSMAKAGATYTILLVYWLGATTTFQGLMGTINNGSTDNGFGFGELNDMTKQTIIVSHASVTDTLRVMVDAAVSTGVWLIDQLSLTANGSSFFSRNGAYLQVSGANTFTATYTSPTSSNSTYALTIGAQAGSGASLVFPMLSGGRIAYAAMWNRALSKGETDTNFEGLRARWGL